jgi:hypothetical protein
MSRRTEPLNSPKNPLWENNFLEYALIALPWNSASSGADSHRFADFRNVDLS